jgi:hypothetical protein
METAEALFVLGCFCQQNVLHQYHVTLATVLRAVTSLVRVGNFTHRTSLVSTYIYALFYLKVA